MVIVMVSWDRALQISLELYFGDCLEMAGLSAVTLRRYSAQSLLMYTMALKCMTLCASWASSCTTITIL